MRETSPFNWSYQLIAPRGVGQAVPPARLWIDVGQAFPPASS